MGKTGHVKINIKENYFNSTLPFTSLGGGEHRLGEKVRLVGKGVAVASQTRGSAHLPSLLCDDHLCLVSVELQPQGPVAQIHLRFARNQSCLRGGKLVKSPSLVRVSILLRVRVARRRVALRRSVGQKAVVSSVRYDRVVGHVAARTPDRESRVRWSMLTRVREHGAGSC